MNTNPNFKERLLLFIMKNNKVSFVLGTVVGCLLLTLLPKFTYCFPKSTSISAKSEDLKKNSLDIFTNKDYDSNNGLKTYEETNENIQSLSGTKPRSAVEQWLQKYRDTGTHPNVLFIIADDMRPEIGANLHTGSPWLEPSIVTPNLDQLASKGLLFRRAYCQSALCNPSRSSFLTSRRPETTGVHNNTVNFRQVNPDIVTLPQYFKENGYVTLSNGKIYHVKDTTYFDNEFSWSEPAYWPTEFLGSNGRAWETVKQADRNGKLLLDEAITKRTLETLEEFAENGRVAKQPFFLAYGLKKPHFNLQFPVEFGAYYPLEDVSLPANPSASASLPDVAWTSSIELKSKSEYKEEYAAWNKTHALAQWVTRELRRAYYSCITYIDDLIGQVLRHLRKLGLDKDTIIVFLGDHGFHLGEHSIIGKCTSFEVANNSPLIISIPGLTDGGMVSDELVEFVDLFPTLAELTGLPAVPYCPSGSQSRNVMLCTEGTSLVPLIENPKNMQWKDRVFFQYPHKDGDPHQFYMGYTVRSKRYRYTEWVDFQFGREVPSNWSNVHATELYDHSVDPMETNNLAQNKMFQEVREDLSTKLREGWIKALPS